MSRIFDTELLLRRKLRAARMADDGAMFLMHRACEDLAERLSSVDRRFAAAVAANGWTDTLARTIAASGKVDTVTRQEADAAFGGDVVAPFETVPFASGSVDLYVSLLAMQDMNDLPGFLAQVRRCLKPDGLFLGALAGGETLRELRQSMIAAESGLSGGAGPRVSPMVDMRDAGTLLQRAGFALPVVDVEPVTVRYRDVGGLMRDLRAMGATNVLVGRKRHPDRSELFAAAAQDYAARYSDADGRIRATFEFVWMSGWAPHESQQKPLPRGSATTRLEEALKSLPERSTDPD